MLASVSSPSPITLTMPSEDATSATSPDEPPDRSSLPRPISMQGPTPVAASFKPSFTSSSYSTSPTVPYSPYVADSTGGSASDYEHECDSPSSLSSWNSWAGGRRGDLADVEDLELDGVLGAEPELETVSELDEESSGFFSGSDRAGMDSDDDARNNLSNKLNVLGLGLDASGSRRKNVRVGGHFNDVSHSHHVHHTSNQHHYHHPTAHHSPAPPSFPHFSPKAGGHGLSHASRYSLRAPPNLAARRKKGRIAELAEEGAGESINTTVMPKTSSRKDKGVAREEEEIAAEDPAPSQTETEGDGLEAEELLSPSTPTLQSSSHGWGEFEFVGPPALPIRCVSPSETVPVVPSPLCVCLNAEEQTAVEEKAAASSSDLADASDSTSADVTFEVITPRRSASPPSPTTSGKSVESFPATASTPSTSPPTSPQLVRKSSRGRRSSSPGRIKPKIPLRPCFRRRASAQVGSHKQAETSSSDCESTVESSNSLRGRGKVRFSEAPPTEVRTHSPVEYDRKACPISNRLSPSDVEELREMKMEMGLLEAKWAAMAACKPEVTTDGEEGESERATLHLPVPSPSQAPPRPQEYERKRADSISSSSPSRFCKTRFNGRDTSISPADHLRIEREKERERACRLAGIGTGIGFRYSGGGTTPRQLHHGGSKTPGACNPASIISRFGLSKPPPPLPGCTSPTKATYEGGTSLHRPSSAPPVRSAPFTLSLSDREDSPPRGRTLNKSSSSRGLNDSTSTDGTITESASETTSINIPELIQTCPSPSTSPERPSINSISPPKTGESLFRPSILPHQPRPTPPPPSVQASPSPPHSMHSISYSSSPCGYDSPASEFYESGSEYDLIG